MADDMQRLNRLERDVEQAITVLKRGAHLLKYGRRGKPKFCPFRISSDESTLIWYDGNEERQLELCCVLKIVPGQRTVIFQRYPRPEKEYQSFSLIYGDRSLDLICKDKDEAEIWFTGLKALIARSSKRKCRNDSRSENGSLDTPSAQRVTSSLSFSSPDCRHSQASRNGFPSRLGKVFSEVASLTAAARSSQLAEPVAPLISPQPESSNVKTSGLEVVRVSLSSVVSSSSQSSCIEDFDNLGDVFIWGEGTGDGVMGGSLVTVDGSPNVKISNSLLPKLLESTLALNVQTIACGHRHAVLVSKRGEIFSWGEEAGGMLGHGVISNASEPKLIQALGGNNVNMVACGTYHTCAVTTFGELYTWGNGSLNSSVLGHGSGASHWIPKKVSGPLEGLQVSYVACGPWHTALLTSTGQLFTFGDGTFGVLGHGDRCSISVPREVEALKGLKTKRVACGAWHTAATVEIMCQSPSSDNSKQAGKVFTWGDGDKGRLGHGDYKSRLVPELISSVADIDFSQVDCGDDFTVALTTSGRVYVMGSTIHIQKESSMPDVMAPTLIKGNIMNICVEEISCGSHHVAILTSKGQVYTWGKGAHGQLGHGDNDDRPMPTLLAFLKDKQVKSIACGSNFTAAVSLHKGISSADNSMCSGCHILFTFIRKRHNCYNCGLVFCNACSSRKSAKASLAPSRGKPYRVCDVCYAKLQKTADLLPASRIPTVKSEGLLSKSSERSERESRGLRLPGVISRLSSAESFKSDRNSTFSMNFDSNENRMCPRQDRITHRRSISLKSPTSPSGALQNFRPFSFHESKSILQASSPVPGKSPQRSTVQSPSSSLSLFSSESFRPLFFPDSGSSSQFSSPVPGKSPWRSTMTLPPSSLPLFPSQPTIEDLKSNTYCLSLEVKSLREQVDKLTSKSEHLEAELEKKLQELKEATAQAADEAEKNKAAKELIKSLSAQLKEMAERMPDKQVTTGNTDMKERMTIDNSSQSNGYNVTSTGSPNSVSSDNSTASLLSNGTREAQKSEWTKQDEPGVYITIASLPNGVNELRRIRFSRKIFTEAEAEEWWTENGTKLCQRHNVRLQGSDS